MQNITTYYLEMLAASEHIAKQESNGLSVNEAEIDVFELNRFLYQYVGQSWEWVDRLGWSDAQWKAYVEDQSIRTWVAYFKGSIAGYFELNAQDNGNTEIAYFGLAPKFIGKGFGGYLLSQAIQKAWNIKSTKRVWVHTCTLDHPSALSNYQARGLKIYREESSSV